MVRCFKKHPAFFYVSIKSIIMKLPVKEIVLLKEKKSKKPKPYKSPFFFVEGM